MRSLPFDAGRDYAEYLDAQDEVAAFRSRFFIPPGTIYLDGNSLGLLSVDAELAVYSVLEQWKALGVEGWTEAEPDWFTLAERLGAQTAELVGGQASEVVLANSTTVNQHQLLATLFDPGAGRHAILADELNFASDIYALQSQVTLRGLDPSLSLVLVRSRDGVTLDEDDLIAAMTPEVQIALFPSVLYRSGQLLEMERLTREAHRRGILIGFDCSHSIGALQHHLSRWGVDFAFWCSYKYLNGGPGAAAGLYLNKRHHHRAPGMAGWFGNRKEMQFRLDLTFEPADGAGALQIGTPNILSLAPLVGTLPMFAEAGMERLRAKSLALTDYLMQFVDHELREFGVAIVTPRTEARRGGHVALRHPAARALGIALRANGVVPDFRPPDILRLAPAPLYVSFLDCYLAIARLRSLLESRSYETLHTKGGPVT
ncbi:MAG: kynureninase [Chthonomonadaceae bacterium]|nr:kynureninase [Chthonomonadaceae bacterium]